jgi:hypothetical protein
MATKYPAHIDDNTSLPDVIDNITPLKAETLNRLKEAIIAIQEELGVNPAGVSSDVKDRFNSLEETLNNIQVIDLDGDLGGTFGNPLVIGLRGTPLSSTEPQAGQVLYYNGLVWLPYTLPAGTIPFVAGGDLSGSSLNQTVTGLQGNPISSTDPTNSQVLQWNGTSWTPITLDLDVDEVQSGANYGNYLTITLPIINSSTNSNIFTTIGTFEFNKSLYRAAGAGTRSIKLKIIAETTGPEITIRLYNFTEGAVVTNTTLNSTSVVNTLLETIDISSNLSTGSAIYNIQMSIDTVNPAENADLTYAALEIEWS